MANAIKHEGALVADLFPPEEKPEKADKKGKAEKVDKAVQQTIDMLKQKGE
jgi:hypothetical protein